METNEATLEYLRQIDPREALDQGKYSLAENAFRVRSGRQPIPITTYAQCFSCGTTHAEAVCPWCSRGAR